MSEGLSEDQIVQLFVVAMAAAHVVVLALYWFRRNLTPVLVLNLALSGAVLAYWVPHIDRLFGYVDLVVGFVLFELAVFVISIMALAGSRLPRAAAVAVLVANMILTLGALYFLLSFKLTRLF